MVSSTTSSILLLLATYLTTHHAVAFTTVATPRAPLARSEPALFSTSSPTSVTTAKGLLLQTAERLKSKNGVFIVDPKDQVELQDKVKALEDNAKMEAGYQSLSALQEEFLGDWTLISTTASPKTDLRQFPGLPNSPIRDSIAKASNLCVKVQQRVRSDNNGTLVNRVDHIIEYEPPAELGNLVSGILPDAIANLKIPNPLQVSKTKVILCHDATVSDSSSSLFQTKLTLKSAILNVAGTSTVLDPQGSDVWSLNIPGVEDLLGRDKFETTYMDDTVRISRTNSNVVDQIRVFVRTPTVSKQEDNDSTTTTTPSTTTTITPPKQSEKNDVMDEYVVVDEDEKKSDNKTDDKPKEEDESLDSDDDNVMPMA